MLLDGDGANDGGQDVDLVWLSATVVLFGAGALSIGLLARLQAEE